MYHENLSYLVDISILKVRRDRRQGFVFTHRNNYIVSHNYIVCRRYFQDTHSSQYAIPIAGLENKGEQVSSFQTHLKNKFSEVQKKHFNRKNN